MRQKNTKGIKIKRAKNSLYKRKKSGARKTIELIGLIIVVAGLAFVGYTIADTVNNLRCEGCEKHPFSCVCETPKVPVDSTESEDSTNAPETQTQDVTDTPAPVAAQSVVHAPANVLSNSATLMAFINEAKSDGFDGIVIDMKDESGRLLYNSEITIGNPPTPLANDTDIVTGVLSAQTIAQAIADEGLRPVARINTLKDHIASNNKIQGVSYAGWVDGSPDAGGRRWANPFSEGTRTYVSHIVDELCGAGFEEIIFTNTIFPTKAFSPKDLSILPPHVTDFSTRYVGLAEFVNTVADSNPDVTIHLEIQIEGVFGELPSGTAEILRADSFSPNVAGIIPVFTAKDLSEESGEDADGGVDRRRIKKLLETVSQHGGELLITPLLDVADLSDNDRDTAIAAFKSSGYEKIMQRN
ncbi:MAG: putative glycoside hydrolase [Oscillospiraceae bacterium]|nr:putative glycoside hydrolase [Oscillospiraceae bacterium]